jgi:hypothetical protein
MKKYFLTLFLCLIFIEIASAQFFNQDFNASTTIANYASATPNIRQFDGFNTTSTATITATGNTLNFVRGATAGSKASATRVTNISGIGTGATAYIVRFNVTSCTQITNLEQAPKEQHSAPQQQLVQPILHE